MNADALIVWGGWESHQPLEVGELFEDMLSAEGFRVDRTNDFDAFQNLDRFANLRLIVPVITMSKITPEQCSSVCKAVEGGVGMAGCHGGMCDSFRETAEWQFLTGGQWVAHPGDDGVRYRIEMNRQQRHPVTEGIEDFDITSEQYYLHTDPGNKVLATTRFPHPGVDGPHVDNPCHMPQVWTKHYGQGRVFYCAIGHDRAVLEEPAPKEIMRRGFLWASGALS